METQLEILCKQPDSTSVELNSCYEQKQANTNNANSFLQNFITKIIELTKTEKQSHNKHVDDDWEIPFERIRIYQKDFQRAGSQGHVYYGKINDTPLAVKRVQDIALTKIRHLGELNHKNVIKFKGISENSNYYYIIMEWCPYGTLHDHIHSGRQISSTVLSDFTHQIASGMKYLHSKNIIHRDLKPSNILLTHNNILKISDFGTHKAFNDNLTATSVSFAGTHAYMAPEVFRGEQYSFPIDVWSYGVVLWEILTGDEPYKGWDTSAVVWAVGNNSFRLPIPFSFPEGFTRILKGCWDTDPSKRFTFSQICMILKGAIHEVNKIPKQRWIPLQAEYKRQIKDELNRHLRFQGDPSEDSFCRQKRQAWEDALERAQKMKNKNNDLYLMLQETFMHLNFEREELAKQKMQLQQERLEGARERENHENAIRELNLIKEELKARNIKLDCLSSTQ